MSLRDSARTGRDVYWTRRGIDELGGGFLGLFLLKLTEKCEQSKKRKASGDKGGGFFNKLVDLITPGHEKDTEAHGSKQTLRGGAFRSGLLNERKMMNSDYFEETEFLKRTVRLVTEVRLVKSEECNVGYSEAFKSNSDFTEFISKVVDKVAEEQGLKHWREYYTLDHVLYKEEDQIPEGVLPFGSSCVHGTWLKHFRLIIEHENSLDAGGGYQEFSKLMLFNADMKVLMGYANKGDNYDAYAKDYQRIYESIELSADVKPILFIGEYANAHFDAYLITKDGLLKYKWDANAWELLDCNAHDGMLEG